MMVFLWLFRLVSPIISVLGMLVLCSGEFGEYDLIIGAALAVVGFIIGLTTWAATVPPRWFWVKSRLDLFESRIYNAFGYALQFFLIPCCITGIMEIVDRF